MIKFSELNQHPPVGLLNLNGSHGTCFFLEYKDKIFMVTDHHVIKNGSGRFYADMASIEMKTQDSTINNVLRYSFYFDDFQYWDSEKEDLFILLFDLSSDKVYTENSEFYSLGSFSFGERDIESLWGKSVFTLGYPTSIKRPSPFDIKPFLTKNIICSFDKEVNQFVIGSFSFYGYSGSPVFYSYGMGKLFLAGIVQQLIPFEMQWTNKFERDYYKIDWHHSGNTICKSYSVIKEIIENGYPTHKKSEE